jgi:hypothetical protein
MSTESGGTAIITSELSDEGVRVSTVHTVHRRIGFDQLKMDFEKNDNYLGENSKIFDEHGSIEITFGLTDLDRDSGLIRITGTRFIRSEKIEGVADLLLGIGEHIKQDIFHSISPEIKDLANSDAEAIAAAIWFIQRKADDLSDR